MRVFVEKVDNFLIHSLNRVDYRIKILIIEKTLLVFIQNFSMLFKNTKENQLTLTTLIKTKKEGAC